MGHPYIQFQVLRNITSFKAPFRATIIAHSNFFGLCRVFQLNAFEILCTQFSLCRPSGLTLAYGYWDAVTLT